VAASQYCCNPMESGSDVPGSDSDGSGSVIVDTLQPSKPPDLLLCCTVEGCNFTTKHAASLSRHRGAHAGTYFTCEVCGTMARSKSELQDHMTIKHMTPLVCDQCSETFHSRHGLRKHILHVHTQLYNHQCFICGKKFFEKCGFTEHMLLHSDSTPHNCEVCFKKFASRSSMRRHQRACSGSEQVQCDVCDKWFKSRRAYRSHKDIEHSNLSFSCPCGKVFRWKQSLERHVSKGCSGLTEIECEICHKVFKSETTCQNHKIIKHGTSTYSCHCGKIFRWKQSFDRHGKTCLLAQSISLSIP
jgi:KRAB domain-containing zinc finger protein